MALEATRFQQGDGLLGEGVVRRPDGRRTDRDGGEG
jgi:hypothetical protein